MMPPGTASSAAPSPQNNVILGHKNRNVSFRVRVVISLLCAREHIMGTVFCFLFVCLSFWIPEITRAHYKKVTRSLKAPKTINHYHKEDFFIMVKHL